MGACLLEQNHPINPALSIPTRKAIEVEQRKRSFERFFRFHAPRENYIYGTHTLDLIHQLDKTTKMVEDGKTRYLIITIPPRHGKSDVCSRRWPAWHAIRNPDHEVIIATYGYKLASSMSYDSRTLLKESGADYNVIPTTNYSALDSWRLSSADGTNYAGAIHSCGLEGVIAGRGADIMIVDDYYKSRAEAESSTIRERVQEGFGPNLFTRLAPAHALIIVANRWKDTDLVGWILEKNNPDSEDYDPEFPVFEHIKYPAWNEDTGKFLFEERWSQDHYKKQRAMCGTYSWASQFQQEPTARGGNRFKTGPGHIVYHSSLDEFPDRRYFRFWDVASSEKERGKSDPDYTVGALVVVDEKDGLQHVWIKDVVMGRWEAPERNRKIISIAKSDNCMVGVESVAGYKDTYDIVRQALRGIRRVIKVTVSKDKGVRAEPLEAIFEAGHIHIMSAGWNRAFVEQFSAFPDGAHDDIVDGVSGGYHMAVKHIRRDLGFDRGTIGI